MINWDVLRKAEVKTLPFPHLVAENFIDSDTVDKIFNSVESNIFEFKDDGAAWRVDGSVLSGNLAKELNEWYGWHDLMLDKLGIKLNSNPTFSLQGSSTDNSFGPHTDDHFHTGVFAKIMIYMTPGGTEGTRLSFNHKPDRYIPSSGNPGSFCLFPCNSTSWHYTDFTKLPPGSKRLCMVGNFVDRRKSTILRKNIIAKLAKIRFDYYSWRSK